MNTATMLYRSQWNTLTEAEAIRLLQEITNSWFQGFSIKKFEKFGRFEQKIFSAILDFQGTEFVFVPGDTVTLGLDQVNFSGENLANILEIFDGNETAMNEYFHTALSPVRTVTIPPMLVERIPRETGWFEVAADDPRLADFDSFPETMAAVQASERENYTYTVNESYRVKRRGSNISIQLYEGMDYDKFVASVVATGFRIPTEDEWEYLAGGGSRTLYPWGNQLDYTKKYHHFETGHPKEEPYFLDMPNHFGLVIANNPYHSEILMDSEYFLRGGDGGCAICGGGGLDLGYFPAATYARDPNIFDEDMAYKDQITGEYNYYRRILHIPANLPGNR
ncbi:SUMF1/EgtB/PvdO family nonheme iron enzyme [Chitinophaga sp. Cy-1792]|uniref:SUMF1/EgtB/PvdO family nonheme iron enzyme n=1 Tax=Chitinophaga sp. Cy-1792 TaxID=2608339 RepID=UPI00141E8355|nr:SUMF1/EgtB/PvdO family nonheme iron enzyme [Chitinophaga sp. Cy-1792]